ncbi:MAG: DUF1853 family protein [Acinetobacter sp.]
MQDSNVFFEPWRQFNSPIVRQLAFALASPNILSEVPADLPIKHRFELHPNNFWKICFERYYVRLIELDHHPEIIINFLAPLKSTRLGLRFEHLLKFWLSDNPDCRYHPYQLLAHGLQQIQGAHTLGELDFVLLNHDTGEIEHWEVALKYYLAEKTYGIFDWYGLNRDDTLFKKLNHFSEKQFQFSNVLNSDIDKNFAVLKGQLYLPQHSTFPTPSWINTQRRLGFWGHTIPAEPMFYLSRHEWICPNAHNRSLPARWWRNNLYVNANLDHFYMFRLNNMKTFPLFQSLTKHT